MAFTARAEHLVEGLRRFRPLLGVGFSIVFTLVFSLTSTPAAAVDIVGKTTATFGWTAASGPVGSYRVYVARNTTAFPTSAESTVSASSRSVTISAKVGDAVKVRIAAVSAAGTQGPYSPESVQVRFVTSTGAAVVTGDLDDDGRADLLLWANSGSGLTARSLWSSSLRTITSAPAQQGAALVDAGDYDGDGIADLLWRTKAGELRLCLNNKVTANDCRTIGYVGPVYMVSSPGDVNGDGRRDVLFQGVNQTALLCMGAPTALTTCANLAASFPTSYVTPAGDANGDGIDDVLVQTIATGQVKTCSISGLALTGCTTTVTVPSGWSGTALGDLNGDGRDDMILRSGTTTIFLCPRAASGSGLQCVAYTGPTSGWTYLGSEDYDGDARPDLVWREGSSGTVRIDLLNGTVRKGSSLLIPIATSQQLLVF